MKRPWLADGSLHLINLWAPELELVEWKLDGW